MVDEPVAPPTYYNPDNDPVAGGSHFDQSAQPGARVYDPSHDPVTGVTPGDDAPSPGARILNTSWRKISDGATALWDLDKGGTTLFQTPENRTAGWEGLKRGVRDVGDFFINETTKAQQQAALERQANEQQYGDNPSYRFGRFGGQTLATLPVTIPLGMGASGLTRMALSPVVDTAVARGVPGILGRATERGVSGAATGGAQAGMTADPAQPFWPQVATGAATGGGLTIGGGLATDAASNIARRVSGGVTPLNPRTGTPYDIDMERARNAQILLDHDVPVMASQVSADPLLQVTSKYGGRIPGSGAGDAVQDQAQQFRNAALRHVDPTETGSIVNQPFIDKNETAIGQMYDGSVRAVRSVPATNAAGVDINDAMAGIRMRIPGTLEDAQINQINRAVDHVQDEFNAGPHPGQITGETAHVLVRRTNSPLSPLLDSDSPTVRGFGMDIRNAINDRLQTQMTPQQQVMFNQANQQWRALQTLRNVADSNGSFHPGVLHDEAGSVTERFGNPGTLDPLARAGDSVIQPTLAGSSGPAIGARMAAATSPIGAGLTSMYGLHHYLNLDPVTAVSTGGTGTAAAVAAGLAANRLLQQANRLGGPRAVNTVLSGGGAPTTNLDWALRLLAGH